MTDRSPLIIEEQGSFAAGGTIVTHPGSFNGARPKPEGQTLRGDHAHVFYQIPPDARKLPLVMWHGGGQFSRTWQTTPDGREGFQTLFLRRGFATYLLDHARRGGAGRSTVPFTIPATCDEQENFNNFRFGVWPDFFPGVQFSRAPAAFDQFCRQATPDTGPVDLNVVVSSVTAVLERTGPSILVTHSQSGGLGWLTAVKSPNVMAIAAYEPGSNFVFPEGDVPAPLESAFNGGTTLAAVGIPASQFEALTRIPIVIYYGDNIPGAPTDAHADRWRLRLEMAKRWRDAVNRLGGDVTLVHLPQIGITGNTHFPMSDTNNCEIADLLSDFLREKSLDLRS